MRGKKDKNHWMSLPTLEKSKPLFLPKLHDRNSCMEILKNKTWLISDRIWAVWIGLRSKELRINRMKFIRKIISHSSTYTLFVFLFFENGKCTSYTGKIFGKG